MFCGKCGIKLSSDQNFCTGCGSKIEKIVEEEFYEQNNAITEEKELLIEGSGKDSLRKDTVFFWGFILAVISAGISIWFAYILRDYAFVFEDWRLQTSSDFGTASYMCFGIAGISFIYYLVIGGIISGRISETSIYVSSTHVVGRGVDPQISISMIFLFGFGWSRARLSQFNLPISQIVSVDIDESTGGVIVRTAGASYKVYADNGYDIATVFRQVKEKTRNKI